MALNLVLKQIVLQLAIVDGGNVGEKYKQYFFKKWKLFEEHNILLLKKNADGSLILIAFGKEKQVRILSQEQSAAGVILL